MHREAAPGRLRAEVEFVQPMGATSFAVLRVPDRERIVQDREHVMATIGPEEEFDRDAPSGSRFAEIATAYSIRTQESQ